jgi:E3 ubiquitin-protein ligase MYCBP2
LYHTQIDLTGTTSPLLTTPNRFTRTSQSAYWNTGNGSQDAVCFCVDRPGVVIAGVCVYGGGGHYDYQVDLLDDVSLHLKLNYMNKLKKHWKATCNRFACSQSSFF